MGSNRNMPDDEFIQFQQFINSIPTQSLKNTRFKEILTLFNEDLFNVMQGKLAIKACPVIQFVNGEKCQCVSVKVTFQARIAEIRFGRFLRALVIPGSLQTVRQSIFEYTKSETHCCYDGQLQEQIGSSWIIKNYSSESETALFDDSNFVSEKRIEIGGQSDVLTEGACMFLMRLVARKKTMRNSLKFKMLDSNLGICDTIINRIRVKPGRFRIERIRTLGKDKETLKFDYRASIRDIGKLIRWDMDGASIFELQQYLENLRTFKKKLPASVEEPRPSSNDLNEVSGDSSTALQQTAETKFDQSSVNDEESSVENLLKNLKFVVFDARSPSPDRNNIKRRLQKRLPVNESIDLVCVVADLFKSFEKKANGEELTRPEVNLDLLESGEADMELEHLFNEHSRKNSEILNMSNEDGVGNDSRFVLNNDQRMDVDTSDSSSEERAGKNVQNVPDGRYSAKPFKVAQELPENEVFEAVSLGSSVKNFSSTSEAKNDNNTPIIKAVAEIFTSMFILTKNNSAKILNDIVQQVTENGDVNIFKTAPPIPHSLINNFNSALAAWKEKRMAKTAEYLRRHPELKTQVSAYLSRVISEKPEDLQAFAANHFSLN